MGTNEAHTIHVDIVSAKGEFYAGEAKMVFVPASGGEIGIAPRHAPLLTTMKAGEVRVQDFNEDERLFWLGSSALEVQPYKITILADTAAQLRAIEKLRQLRKGS